MKEKIKHMRGFYGVSIPPAVGVLPKYHPCYRCIWYAKDTNVLFCPFHNCVRNKKEINTSRLRGDKNAD